MKLEWTPIKTTKALFFKNYKSLKTQIVLIYIRDNNNDLATQSSSSAHHKVDLCDQLNEVTKLMSPSPVDGDLFSNLQ